MTINLRDTVLVAEVTADSLVWRVGTVVARTVEQSPRYDVRLGDGTIRLNVPAGQIKPAVK